MIGIHRPGSRYRLKTVPAFLCTVAVISLFGWICFISLNQDDLPSSERIQFQEEMSVSVPIIPPVELIDTKISPEVEPSVSNADNDDDVGVHRGHANRRQYYSKRDRRAIADEPRLLAEQLLNPSYEELNKDKVVLDRTFFDYMASELQNASFPGVDYYIKYTVARLGLKPLTQVTPLLPEFGPVLNDVTSFKYPLTMPPCSRRQSAPRSIFVAVNTAPGYFAKRESIRQTWARDLRHQSDLMDGLALGFIVGVNNGPNATAIQKQLEQESATYGDIIQIDMMDNYYNITLKVAGLLNWIHNYCSTADFVLKVDDDVYVNVRNLATSLQTLQPSSLNAYGVRMPFLEVVRESVIPDKSRDKWRIQYDSWPWRNYPLFLRGASVLMAGKAITPLLAAFQVTPFIPFDDVFLTGVITSKAGVKIYNNEGMFDVQPEFPLDACMARDSISWLTDSIEEMKASHIATEQFYNGARRCINLAAYGANAANYEIADPKAIVDFPFMPILD